MLAYTKQEAVEAIRERDSEIAIHLFRKNFRHMRWLMLSAGISDYDPYDMFSDVMYSIYKRFDNPDFVLTCDIDSYFLIVFENQKRYFKYRQSKLSREFEEVEIDEADRASEMPDYERLFDLKKLHGLINQHLLRIAKECRRIMNLFLLGFKNKEVSKRMKRPYDATRTLKSRCRKKLEDAIKEDPEYDAIRRCEDNDRNETT